MLSLFRSGRFVLIMALLTTPLSTTSSSPFISVSNLKLDRSSYVAGSNATLSYSVTAGAGPLSQIIVNVWCGNQSHCPIPSAGYGSSGPPTIPARVTVGITTTFSLLNVPPGPYNLTLTVLGYTSFGQLEGAESWIILNVGTSGQSNVSGATLFFDLLAAVAVAVVIGVAYVDHRQDQKKSRFARHR